MGLGLLILALGQLEDMRFPWRNTQHTGLQLTILMLLIYGLIAFVRAWLWAGRTGPAQRRTSRALGMAFGFLVTALAVCHGIYFRWIDFNGPTFRW